MDSYQKIYTLKHSKSTSYEDSNKIRHDKVHNKCNHIYLYISDSNNIWVMITPQEELYFALMRLKLAEEAWLYSFMYN